MRNEVSCAEGGSALRRLVALAALAFLSSAPAAAQDRVVSLSIAPGEIVTARVADDASGFVVIARATTDSSAAVNSPHPAVDTLRFTFDQDGEQRMLRVENGYQRGFNYRARMFRGTRSAPTSVCTVMAGISTFESWPHPIDRLELSSPSLSEAAGTIHCQ